VSLHAVAGTTLDDPSDLDFDDKVDIESKASKVEVGYNFIVYSHDVDFGDPFYVLRCNQPSFMYEETFADG
jgi:hypothetical protein